MATHPGTDEDAAEQVAATEGDVPYAPKDEALVIAQRVASEDAEILRRLAK